MDFEQLAALESAEEAAQKLLEDGYGWPEVRALLTEFGLELTRAE